MMDYITGTHLINTIFNHSIHLPVYFMNLILFLTKEERRIVVTHWIFKKKFKLNFGPFEILKR